MKRNASLDGIRGILLVVMTINHLIWISSGYNPIQLFTLQPLGQVGAAEGFIFISGLIAGMVYSSDKLSEVQARNKAWARAWTIWRYHIVTLVIVAIYMATLYLQNPVYEQFALYISANYFYEFWHSLWLSALLLNQPAYFDILPLYILLMLTLPLILAGLRRGLWWLVLATSAAMWSASGMITADMAAPFFHLFSEALIPSFGYFDFFAWQLIFSIGVTVGYYQRHQPVNWYPSPWLTATVAIVAGLLMAAHHNVFAAQGINQGILYQYADKPELGWLRLGSLLLWAYLLGAVLRILPNLFRLPFFTTVGQHSLQVFAWQTLLIFFAAPPLFSSQQETWYELAVLGCTATLWFPAWLHSLWQNRTQLLPKEA